MADAIRTALTEHGRCAIALSGGSTPAPMFARLATLELEWSHVDVFQVDERVAPDGHPDRNLTRIGTELLARIAGDRPRVHAMPVVDGDVEAAADRYAAELQDVCGRPPVLDVVHLGLGSDGHTASLVSGDPVGEVEDRWVAVTGPYEGRRRMTLTHPALGLARLVVCLVAGAGKSRALAGLLARDPTLPAGRLTAHKIVVCADQLAAASASR